MITPFTIAASKSRNSVPRCHVPMILVLVGLQGAGKSHFANMLVQGSHGLWKRVNQDELGSQTRCETVATQALSGGHHVIIDRTNISRKARMPWVAMAQTAKAQLIAIKFEVQADECILRCRKRKRHEGGITARNAQQAVEGMAGRLAWPEVEEGFHKVLRVRTFAEAAQLAGLLVDADLSRVAAYASDDARPARSRVPNTAPAGALQTPLSAKPPSDHSPGGGCAPAAPLPSSISAVAGQPSASESSPAEGAPDVSILPSGHAPPGLGPDCTAERDPTGRCADAPDHDGLELRSLTPPSQCRPLSQPRCHPTHVHLTKSDDQSEPQPLHRELHSKQNNPSAAPEIALEPGATSPGSCLQPPPAEEAVADSAAPASRESSLHFESVCTDGLASSPAADNSTRPHTPDHKCNSSLADGHPGDGRQSVTSCTPHTDTGPSDSGGRRSSPIAALRPQVPGPRGVGHWGTDFRKYFEVAVFDLDHTLWNGDCAALSRDSLRRQSTDVCQDANGRCLQLFPHVPMIFSALRGAGCRIGIASQSPAPQTAQRLLQLWELWSLLDPALIVIQTRVSKEKHLQQIKDKGKVDYSALAFFDDLHMNTRVGERLGVTSILVSSGLCADSVTKAIQRVQNVRRSGSILAGWLGKK